VREGSESHFVWPEHSIRDFKLSLWDNGVEAIRSQLHTHTVALKTASSAINVYAPYILVHCRMEEALTNNVQSYLDSNGPDFLRIQLSSQINILTQELTRLTSDHGRADISSDADDATLVRSIGQFKQSAERGLSSGSIVLGRSGPVVDYGSENGEPLSYSHRDSIVVWIAPPIVPENSLDGSTTASTNPSSHTSIVINKAEDGHQFTICGGDDGDDYDSDWGGESEVQVLETTSKKARRTINSNGSLRPKTAFEGFWNVLGE